MENAINGILNGSESFRYQMLDRLRSDCDYYLGNGGRSARVLWAQSVADHIDAMKQIWNSFATEDKPEWLSWADILKYKSEMGRAE